MRTKVCWNCRGTMWWNKEEKMWECMVCGYAEETKLRTERPNYVG
jgi:exosome complex RNA-binding protein Csl4